MPARRPRLFVSHSSRSEPARERLRALIKALKKGDDHVEVLYDKAVIREGLPWRDEIDGMLAECDAAIVLITADALASPWVLKEGTILRWRYDQEFDRARRRPGFELVPVLWSGADGAALRKHPLWRPLDLPAVQYAQEDDPAALAGRIQRLLAPLAERLRPSPLDLIAADLVDLLSAASPMRLAQAAAALGEEVPGGRLDRERLAYAIARWTLRQPPPALNALVDALARLGEGLPAENARRMIDAVAHFWVASEAAAWLLQADPQAPSCRDLALACAYPADTVRQYVERAHRPWKPPTLVALNAITGGDQVDDIAAELRREMHRRFNFDPATIDEKLADAQRRFFVALPLPDDPAVVRALQARYPRVTFIFTVARGHPVAAMPAGVEWVEPDLDPELEEGVQRDLFDARLAYG
jgi:TIR domain